MQSTSISSIPRHSAAEQFLSMLLLGIAIFFAALLVVVLGYQIRYSGRIFPGVRMAGVDLGGMTAFDAAARLASSYTYPTQGRILFQDRQLSWAASPAELGLLLDVTSSAQAALNVGRSGGLVQNLQAQLSATQTGTDLNPSLVFDQRQAHAYLSRLAQQVNRPVIEAKLGLQGIEVQVNSGQAGRTLDIPATLLLLDQSIQTQRDGIIPLIIAETPPVVVDPTEQADLARRILSQPLTLTLPSDFKDAQASWKFEQAALAGMLNIELVQSSGAARYQVTLNSATLRDFLSKLSPSLSKEPLNARFIFNDDTHKLEVIQPAVIGRVLDVEGSLKAIQTKLVQGEHTIPLEFKRNQPPVTDDLTAEKLGVIQLVRAETSYFFGSSAERVQNIKAAAAKFHGLMVPPGATFSMSDALGDISLDNGYAEALIISNGRTIKGVGGGVCQVSTTLFRTAFFAGFPIVERHAHAYRVSYYEKVAGNRIDSRLAGLDATVFVPIVDFKFKNDTSSWLLMETYVNPAASSITWKFYSTSDGRKVDWTTTGLTNVKPAPDPIYHENPALKKDQIKQVDWAVEGADITVVRTVTRDGKTLWQDRIVTHYQPWGDVFEYGPGTENLPTPKPR